MTARRWRQRSLRALRMALIASGVVVLAIQAIPVERSNPPVTAPLLAPPAVEQILRKACYDCHSHEVRWPWYSRVAPVAWLIAHDVKEGRKAMNFSRWREYAASKQERLTGDILDEIESGTMPPRAYLLLHPQARLSPPEIATVREWVDAALEADD